MEKNCTSCGVKIANQEGASSFKCPGCSDIIINRCEKCRVNSIDYKCEKCGFIGP